MVEIDVMKRVGQNFRHPDQSGADIKQNEQMACSEQQGCNTQVQPRITDRMHELTQGLMLRDQAPQARVQENDQGQHNPDAEQHHFTTQVVPHLDFFFMLIRRLVDVVIAQRLKEEMTGLPRSHRNQPGNQRSPGGVDEQHHISHQKTHGTQKMQGLIDSAMVVIAVVIPALNLQGIQKIFHRQPS